MTKPYSEQMQERIGKKSLGDAHVASVGRINDQTAMLSFGAFVHGNHLNTTSEATAGVIARSARLRQEEQDLGLAAAPT